MLKVVGYLRVSTAEQATDGVSLAAQRAKVEGFAALHGFDLVDVIEDAGISAKDLHRPGLARALAMLADGTAEGLLIAKLDRLSRSVLDWNRLIGDHFGPDAGHQLMSVADSIDTRTAAGRLVLNIIMSMAQWELETVRERTRDAMQHKRSKGERLGTIPYGMRLGPDGRTLIPDEAERTAARLARELHADGVPLRRIAAELDRLNIPTKSGAPRWADSSVRSLLRRRDPDDDAATTTITDPGDPTPCPRPNAPPPPPPASSSPTSSVAPRSTTAPPTPSPAPPA